MLYIVAFVQTFKEFRAPHEVTQKYITGPSGQRFTEYTRDTASRTEEQALFDMNPTSPEEEAQATEVQRSVRKSVRVSLLGAAVLWFCFALAYLRDLVHFYDQHGVLATGMREVELNWPSNTIYPHAIAVAGDNVFVANKYQIFQVSATGGDVTQVECNVTGTITDIVTQCDDAGNCQPLVLLGGDVSKVFNCHSGEELSLLYEPSPDSPKPGPQHIALRGDKSTMMALSTDGAVVEYGCHSPLQVSCTQWIPFRKRAQLQRAGDLKDFDYWGRWLYLVERHTTTSGGAASRVRILDMDSLEPVGEAWDMPQPIVAGSAIDSTTLLLLPNTRAPNLLRWTVPSER